MQWLGERATIEQIVARLNSYSENNCALKTILDGFYKSNLLVRVFDEAQALSDPMNSTKSLTRFRGYLINNVITLYFTRYETLDSIVSSLLHEVCHAIIQSNPMTFYVIATLNGTTLKEHGVDLATPFWTKQEVSELCKDDAVHERLYEEKMCDSFAAAVTGYTYNREWWRKQIELIDNEES